MYDFSNNILRTFFFNRKPGLTGRGMYELKPECAKEFNLYFYHFSRAEQSKVIGKIKIVLEKSWVGFFFFNLNNFSQIEKRYIFIVGNLEKI